MGGNGSVDRAGAVYSPETRGRGRSAVWGVEVMGGQATGPWPL